MAKKKGHWSRDRDARRAARSEGLKDDEFEVVFGPKGYTYRTKNKHVPVPDAKLHGPKDLDSDVDKEQMTHTELGGCCPDHPLVEIHKGVVDQDASLLQPLEAIAIGVETVETHELPPVLEQEIKEEGLDPEKEELQEKPVFSEKEQANIKAGAEASRQAEEYRQTHNARGEKLLPGTSKPDAIPPRISTPRIHKSTVEGPSKLVWAIAEELTTANPQIKRKEVISECVKRGIAFYTARTQYQVWLAIKRESAVNSAKANGATHERT